MTNATVYDTILLYEAPSHSAWQLRRLEMDSQSSDVAAVVALEPQVRALMETLRAAQPALDRLEKADYPGADMLSCMCQITVDEELPVSEGSLGHLARLLKELIVSGGNRAAYDFHFYGVAEGRETLDAAVKEMIFGNGTSVENLDRVKAMRQYAATVA